MDTIRFGNQGTDWHGVAEPNIVFPLIPPCQVDAQNSYGQLTSADVLPTVIRHQQAEIKLCPPPSQHRRSSRVAQPEVGLIVANLIRNEVFVEGGWLFRSFVSIRVVFYRDWIAIKGSGGAGKPTRSNRPPLITYLFVYSSLLLSYISSRFHHYD